MQQMEFQARSPATAVLHVQDSAENACSMRAGYMYVFLETLVIKRFISAWCLCAVYQHI